MARKYTSIQFEKTSYSSAQGSTIQANLILLPSDLTDSNANFQFSSSDDLIASVDSIDNGIVSIKCKNYGTAVIKITAYSGDDLIEGTTTILVTGADDERQLVEQLFFESDSYTIPINTSSFPTVLGFKPDGLVNYPKVKYKSSNTTIFKVDAYGNIYPISAGRAVLSASVYNESVQCFSTIVINDQEPTTPDTGETIINITGMQFNDSIYQGKQGSTIYTKLKYFPSTANEEPNLTYTSSNTGVALVDNHGVLTLQGIGEATITVVHTRYKKDNPEEIDATFSATAQVVSESIVIPEDVTDGDEIAVSSVTLKSHNLLITVGSTVGLNYSISPYIASKEGVTWDCDCDDTNGECFSVDENGYVTCLSPGNAIIKCISVSDATKFDECYVTGVQASYETGSSEDDLDDNSEVDDSNKYLNDDTVTGIAFDESVFVINVGDSEYPNIEIQPYGTAVAYGTMYYTSQDTNIFTVDSDGMVYGKAEGRARLQATYYYAGVSYNAFCTIWVIPAGYVVADDGQTLVLEEDADEGQTTEELEDYDDFADLTIKDDKNNKQINLKDLESCYKLYTRYVITTNHKDNGKILFVGENSDVIELSNIVTDAKMFKKIDDAKKFIKGLTHFLNYGYTVNVWVIRKVFIYGGFVAGDGAKKEIKAAGPAKIISSKDYYKYGCPSCNTVGKIEKLDESRSIPYVMLCRYCKEDYMVATSGCDSTTYPTEAHPQKTQWKKYKKNTSSPTVDNGAGYNAALKVGKSIKVTIKNNGGKIKTWVEAAKKEYKLKRTSGKNKGKVTWYGKVKKVKNKKQWVVTFDTRDIALKLLAYYIAKNDKIDESTIYKCVKEKAKSKGTIKK